MHGDERVLKLGLRSCAATRWRRGGFAAGLDQSFAFGDVEGLGDRVRVPGGAGTGARLHTDSGQLAVPLRTCLLDSQLMNIKLPRSGL